jgi:nicotinamide mononucleotide transporter
MMEAISWVTDNFIEIFGAVTGMVYVFLEIRQKIWLWPVGVVTSAVYLWVFFTGKLYADMSLQGYYLVISAIGWYWWVKGTGHGAQGEGREVILQVTRLKFKTGAILATVFTVLYFTLWIILSRLTDSPVPEVDSFITSLSVVATWMLARKIYEHWYLWIVVNSVATVLFIVRGLYPTVLLYLVYGIMSFAGLIEWKKSLKDEPLPVKDFKAGSPGN